jgi:HSP90 family molecular chaperone
VTLHLKPECYEYLDANRLKALILKYTEFLEYQIELLVPTPKL